MERINFGDGYTLRSLQNIDAASAPIQAMLQKVFLVTAIAAVLACLALSILSSRTIIRPIASLVTHLKESEKTGEFPEFQPGRAAVKEIRELMESFNRSAAAIRHGRARLYGAYVEFVGSLANALDARDPYTAGHSRRVSEYALCHRQSHRTAAARTGAPAHRLTAARHRQNRHRRPCAAEAGPALTT